jgi:hypothetical protein
MYLKKAHKVGSDYKDMLKLVPEVTEEADDGNS